MNQPSEHVTMVNRATVTFHTSPNVKERLDRLATVTRRSKSFLTNEAVERYLADEEAFVAAVEAGLAQANAGDLVDHDRAAAYLMSLGTDHPLPMPKPTRA
jgi:predicted transcriptional regulator